MARDPEVFTAVARLRDEASPGAKTLGDTLERLGQRGGASLARLSPAADLATGSLRRLATVGVGDLVRDIPVVGASLEGLVTRLSGLPLVLGAVVGAGAGLILWLKSVSTEATKTGIEITKIAESIGAATARTALEVKRIQAESSGGPTGQAQAADLRYQREVVAAEAARDAKIAAAKAELDAVSRLSLSRADAESKFAAQRAAAEADASNTIVVAAAERTAKLVALEDERTKAQKVQSEAWKKLEQDRLEIVVAIDAAIRQSREETAGTLAQIEAEATGSQLAAVEARYQASRATIDREKQDAIERADRAYQVSGDYDLAQRQIEAAVERSNTRILVLDAELARDRRKLVESSTSDLIGLVTRFGDRYTQALAPLRLAGLAQDLERNLGLLRAAFESGLLPLNDYIELTAKLRQETADTATALQYNLGGALTETGGALDAWAQGLAGTVAALDDVQRASLGAAGSVSVLTAAQLTNAAAAETQAAAQARAAALNDAISSYSASQFVASPTFGPKSLAIPDLPSIYFHSGGVVPGPRGAPVRATLQAGEEVIPLGETGSDHATSSISIVIQGDVTVDSERRMEQLAQRLHDKIRDRQRRTLTR